MKKYFVKWNVFVMAIGLAGPVLAATPIADFYGNGGVVKDAVTFLHENPQYSPTMPRWDAVKQPEPVAVLEAMNERGEVVVIQPVGTSEDSGKKRTQYIVQPNWLIRWKLTCAGNGTWSRKVNYSWEPDKGGHAHFNPPPPPMVVSHSQSEQVPSSSEFSYAPSPLTFPTLQGNNVPYYYWVWLPVFGTRLVEWSEAWGACVSNREDWIDVKVSDLVSLPGGSGYVLVGTTTYHPSNHYVSARFQTALQSIGKEWRQSCPKSDLLLYNDMSLVWGGVFDLNRDWNPPHAEHRFGENADVSKKWVRKGNREKLVRTMCKYAEVWSEGDLPKETAPHFHLAQKAAKYSEDLDGRYTPCCVSEDSPVPPACMDLQSGATTYPEVLPEATDCPGEIFGF